MNPINDRCRELLERLKQQAQESVHTHLSTPLGHDAGDEDPNAWSNE